MTAPKAPSWWSDDHSQAWERAKEALRRDWERTKADFGVSGHEPNHSHRDWNPELDTTLREEGTTTLTDTRWDRVKHAVRRGWDSAKS